MKELIRFWNETASSEVLRELWLMVYATPEQWAIRFGKEQLSYTLSDYRLWLMIALPWAVFQFIMLKKCQRKWLRWLPLELLACLVLVGEVLFAILPGWDALAGGILVSVAWSALLPGIPAAVLLWWLLGRKKKKYTAG